jgi:Mg2+ and Co2+ transporter CorA
LLSALQAVGVSADLDALTDHVGRLAGLVVNSMSIGNEQANITLAVIGTIFLPLTFIAGRIIVLKLLAVQVW